MRPDIVHEQATEYSQHLEAIWLHWDPWLRRSERLLHAGAEIIMERDDAPELMRRAQYEAHTAAEFLSGVPAPAAASEAHDFLVRSLSTCRDALSVLAVRTEIGELDERTAELGLRAVAGTRDAFLAARGVTFSPLPFPMPTAPARLRGRTIDVATVAIWSLATICVVLSGLLLLELFVLGQ